MLLLLLPHNLPSNTARSLWECGGGTIADGRLLDLIRRVYSFGMSLLKLDLRQESTRHAETLDAITTYLGYGSYKAWDEDTKCEWITRELETRRPLIPLNMPMTDEVRGAACQPAASSNNAQSRQPWRAGNRIRNSTGLTGCSGQDGVVGCWNCA